MIRQNINVIVGALNVLHIGQFRGQWRVITCGFRRVQKAVRISHTKIANVAVKHFAESVRSSANPKRI